MKEDNVERKKQDQIEIRKKMLKRTRDRNEKEKIGKEKWDIVCDKYYTKKKWKIVCNKIWYKEKMRGLKMMKKWYREDEKEKNEMKKTK